MSIVHELFIQENKTKLMNKEANDAMRYIINVTDSKDKLDKELDEYNSMTKKQRRESDWISQEYRGMNNLDFYNKMNDILIQQDDIKDKPNLDQGSITSESTLEPNAPIYDDDAIYKAEKYSVEAMRTIIVPTSSLDKLEELWIEFKSMIRKNQRESDWKSLELFNVDNETHYNFLKDKLIKSNIPKPPIEDCDTTPIELTQLENQVNYLRSLSLNDVIFIEEKINALSLESYIIDGIYEAVSNRSIVESVINESITVKELPYYTPMELVNRDFMDTKWLSEYTKLHNGLDSTMKMSTWINEVRSLMFTYEKNNDELTREKIINLGWNPDLSFTNENRLLAYNRNKEITKLNTGTTTFIDLTDIVENATEEDIIVEDTKEKLHPIYIVLIEGNSLLSKAIKMKTKGPFSHAAFSFDPKLDKMYSYNLNLGSNKKAGFSIENVKDYNQKGRLAVFSIFVKDDELKRIQNMVDDFTKNIDKTGYSVMNLATSLFDLDLDRDYKLICSQFVDKLLKAADINLTNKTSALVNPNDFFNLEKENKNIYKLYDGIASKYNYHKINNSIKRIKAKYIKESFLMINENTKRENLEININSWRTGNKNILYITGLSGSGKSTLAKRLAKKYSAEIFELDRIEHYKDYIDREPYNLCENILKEYFIRNKITVDTNSISNKEYNKFFMKAYNVLLEYALDHPNQRFIFEGVQVVSQLHDNIDDMMSHGAIIVLNISVAEAIKRRKKRDGDIYLGGEIKSDAYIRNWYQASYDYNNRFQDDIRARINEELIDLEEGTILLPFLETKEFPLQFNTEGDLLIKNMKRINYEEEYYKSHKLLQQYDKSNNIEGMKYELAKLWFLNNLILSTRYGRRNGKKQLQDTRARIMNDFNKYMKIVISKEEDFNFTEYYESTPFSNSTIKVNNSTLKYTSDIFKAIII